VARKKKKKFSFIRFVWVFLILFLIGGLLFLLLESRNQSFLYGDLGVKRPQNFPVLGLDISHHQGRINYEEVVKMGQGRDSIQFVYIKATEDVDHIDSKYDQNAEGFAAFGMKYGFYHYFHPSHSAKKQAAFFIETIKHYNFKLRPVVDIEVAQGQSNQSMVDSLIVFLNEVEKQLNSRPIIYTYVSFYETHLNHTKLSNEDWWFAAYSRDLNTWQHDHMLLWQFSEKGTVDGIRNYVDLNVGREGVLERLKR
jgi:lysozyme